MTQAGQWPFEFAVAKQTAHYSHKHKNGGVNVYIFNVNNIFYTCLLVLNEVLIYNYNTFLLARSLYCEIGFSIYPTQNFKETDTAFGTLL